MAKGKKCPSCGHQMFAEKEKEEKYGTTVWYRCRNAICDMTEKVFEPK